MVSKIYHRQLKFIVIDSDFEKADQLRVHLRSKIHRFSDALSFIGFLASITNAPEYLILLISTQFISNLPLDIKQRVRELCIYTDDPNDKKYQTFKDVCLILQGLVIAQYNAEFVSSRLSNNLGIAKATAIQSMILTKSQIQYLEDLYDDMDRQEQYGQEVEDSEL